VTDLATVSDEDLIASLPRGVRSNNPLNLKDKAGQFRTFPTMDEGIAAADQNLLAYKTRHGIDTINGVVGRWAPAGADGNDPAAYAAHVSKATGIAPDARIDLADANTRHALLSAMGEHENGAPVVPAQKADLSGVSDAELLASLGRATPTGKGRPPGLIQPGNIDLNNRPVVKNADGSISTVRSISVGIDGKTYLIPTVVGNKVVSNADAVKAFQQTGRHLGVFESPDAADAYAQQLHLQQAAQYGAHGKAPPPVRPNPTIAQDAASGFAQPFVSLGHDVMENYRRTTARAGQPLPSLIDAAKQSVGDLGSTAKIVGDLLGVTAAPAMAAIRPTARAIGRVMPAPTVGPQLSFVNGKPVFSAPRRLQGEEAQGAVENALNTALMGARPAAKAPMLAKPAPKDLAQLDAEQHKLWKAVDASGYRFPKADVQQAATDIRQIVEDAGPDLYENSDRIAKRVESLAAKGDLTPAQANRLRSQIGEKLLSPGSTEGSVGGEIKARIDQLIDGANDPTLEAARQAYKQFVKYREVSNRLDDAGLNQAAAGTGGNPNAIRQALKPLIKKKSAQRMRNLSPDESAALKTVVGGTPVQNLLRVGSAFDPFHSRLGTLIQTGLGIKTGGLSAATIPLGIAATAGERAIGANNLQKLLDLISTGGNVPTPAPFYPTLALGGRPALSIGTPAGLIGGSALAALPSRIPSSEGRSIPKRKAAARAR
jgi:predicted transcriptional regulator